MQKSWREDADKLTFIACLPPSRSSSAKDHEDPAIDGGNDDADDKMIGDVNLFLSEATDNEDTNARSGSAVVGELEIMVARKEMQNLGLGTSILLAFLWYIFTHLDSIMLEYAGSIPLSTTGPPTLRCLRVKIDASNERSIRLFERVGFKKFSPTPNYFNELELRFDVSSDNGSILKALGLNEEPRLALYRVPKCVNADFDTGLTTAV